MRNGKLFELLTKLSANLAIQTREKKEKAYGYFERRLFFAVTKTGFSTCKAQTMREI